MPAIGIDLGTSCSCVGVFRNGNVEIITSDLGNKSTPSYVAFTNNHRRIGDQAKSQVALNPENTVFNTKRLIGRKYDDDLIAADQKHFPFKVCNSGGKPKVSVMYKGEQKLLSPEEIGAMVLTKMKEIAEMYLGQKVTDAVITVPACFNDSQRQATKVAGAIAGLNVLRIIIGPTAAALAYGLDKNIEDMRKVLVFDLGGGTLGVTILTIDGSFFEVIAVAGETHLGGEDFDNRMVNYFMDIFKMKHGKDLSNNTRAICRLRTACERAKWTLSSSAEASIEIDALFEGIDFSSKIARAEFEDFCADLFSSILQPVERALSDANIGKNDIDDVVLVGGSSRIPKIRKILGDFFNGKELCVSINPDVAVACGAAIQAAILNNDKSERIHDVLLIDAIPLSLGIETTGGVIKKVVERNSHIPLKISQIFTTHSDNQSCITINVFEGEKVMAKDNNLLGKFKLHDIPSAPSGVPKIEVTFDIDASGILEVSARDMSSGSFQKIAISSDKGWVNEEELNRMLKEAEIFQQDDEKHRAKMSACNSLESYVYSVKEAAADDSRLSQSNKEKVNSICEDVIMWLEDNPLAEKEEIEFKTKEVQTQLYPIVMKLH